MSRWNAGSVVSIAEVGIAQVAEQLDQMLEAAHAVVAVLAAEFDQQQRLRLAAHEAVDDQAKRAMSRARSIIVRSTSSTAVGSSVTICLVAAMAL